MLAWVALMRKVPRKAYWAGLLLLAAIAIFTWRFSTLGKTSMLRLKVQHSFKSAEIMVFIDGESAYRGKLSGASRKRFGFRDTAQGSFSRNFHLRPGRHMVRVEVHASSEGFSESNEAPVDFLPDRERMLAVTADRRSLKMASQTLESATDTVPSWYQGYFTSLSLTVSGSVVSALFGYLVQQLLAFLRKGRTEPSAAQQ